MLVLIVDSYGQKYKKVLTNYLVLVSGFSDLRLIQETEARPGYDLGGIDAVVLSGSEKYITRGQYDEAYLEFVRRVEVPLLGVCYGHQILALAYDQEVVRRSRELIRRKFPKDAERISILEPDTLFRGMGRTLLADESHLEEVVVRDRRFEVLARSASCPVEAIRLKGKRKFGVQFHLERSGEYGVRIMDNFFRLAKRLRRR